MILFLPSDTTNHCLYTDLHGLIFLTVWIQTVSKEYCQLTSSSGP